MQFMTREVFDTLILVVIIIGLAFAFLRLRADLTRPLPPDPPDDDPASLDDTQPTPPHKPE